MGMFRTCHKIDKFRTSLSFSLFPEINYVNKSEFAAWCKEQGYGAFDTQSNTTDQGQKEVKLPDQSVDSSAYKVLSKLFGMPPGTEGQLSQVTSTSNTFKYQSCFFKQDNVYEGSVSNVEGNLKIDIEQHPNKGFLFGVGVGAKNTADNIADFMMKFHPRDIPLILQSAGEKGLLYDLTLGSWTKKGKELLQATNSQEAGTKAFELGADIGSTVAGAGLVRKAGTSLIDASKMVVKGSSNASADIWKLKATDRGTVIEATLAKTKYKDWYNIGAARNGYFPVIDFQKGIDVVSLKTIDPRLSSYSGNRATIQITNYLNDLDIAAKVDGQLANKILDVRIPVGTRSRLNLDSLMEKAKDLKITLLIKEF